MNAGSDARASPPTGDLWFNHTAAEVLRHCGDLLHQQRANPFRVNAYLRAAHTLEAWPVDVREILRASGIDGLRELPHIGAGLAAAIDEIARTGTLARLDRLRGAAEHGGRTHDRRWQGGPEPGVATLLAVDAEYRRAAAQHTLPMIAPRRFNPAHQAWLPILHTDRDGWHFTVLYSNTAKAHELHRTDDWVVIYFYDGDHREGQHTVVTETHGPLAGRRVVRGRETEPAASVLTTVGVVGAAP